MFLKGIILGCISFLAVSIAAQTTTFTINAGPYQKICPGTKVVLGGNPTAQGGGGGYQYMWHPGKSLNDSSIANPTASPTITTTYTVSVTDSARATKSATVTIYVYTYYASVKPQDTTIKEGQTITLHAQAPGDSIVYWSPTASIYNQSTLNPDVFPSSTIQYTVAIVFPHGCTFYETVIVNVIPNSELYFYNSFTPNGDGANDFFYIGNISQYPNNTLDIYNRYGQKIFSETGYNNDWAGNYLGTELPCGTYFYILDTHDKPGKFRGEVSIIR